MLGLRRASPDGSLLIAPCRCGQAVQHCLNIIALSSMFGLRKPSPDGFTFRFDVRCLGTQAGSGGAFQAEEQLQRLRLVQERNQIVTIRRSLPLLALRRLSYIPQPSVSSSHWTVAAPHISITQLEKKRKSRKILSSGWGQVACHKGQVAYHCPYEPIWAQCTHKSRREM